MKVEKNSVMSQKGDITLYKLINGSGASVTLSSLGCGIVSVCVPDKNGKFDDVVLGYADPTDYYYDGPCAGKVPGRYANRIDKGHLVVDGVEYQLAINNGPNALHGGPEGFHNQLWSSELVGDNTVVFTRESADGEENYPGNLKAQVKYTWSEENELSIELSATTDKKTVVNLTNHAYFNLAGENSGSVLNHKLKLNSSKFLPTDKDLIPTGELRDVEGTPMDFTAEKVIGKDIKADFEALVFGKGYDNCWAIDDWKKGELHEVATLTDDNSGRVLEVSSTQPAVQVYTGNWLAGSPKNKCGRSYNDYDGVAIECQGMPDAPNKPNFPSQILNVDEEYKQTILFKFKVK